MQLHKINYSLAFADQLSLEFAFQTHFALAFLFITFFVGCL